jgi:hypothetical protein
MFRWDPLAGPTWIHEIFVWDPHLVGPTHFGLWAHNSIVGFMIKKFMFSHSVSEKDLNNDL